ncbi:acid protease [Decorospora gaudefroyi]|uniref:Acid protease n=1 Tax=Decorospora gaudefroyi TaxID=184978 RepID=A0A6A5KHT9_9PLEO|nr:acid protease [Decorospora gaudefroyi]
MHTSLPSWLALSAAILPTATAFYPYHYDPDSTSASSSRLRRKPDTPSASSITLPLRRVPAGLRSRENIYQIVNSKDPSQENSVAIDQDGSDLSYMVAVTFGDSTEEYHMLLDSAASNTWVMSQDCNAEACKTHATFGEGDSSTLETTTSPFSITYGTGSTAGTLAQDKLHIGTLSPSLTFGLATNVSDEFRAYPMDGILGIGRGSSSSFPSSNDGGAAIMDVLSSSNLIGAKLYGIHLSRATDALFDGELNLGQINTERFDGNINYIPVVDDNDAAEGDESGFWEIPLEDAGVDESSGSGFEARTAIIDTGTSYILMPRPDAEMLHAEITGVQQDGETFFVPCDTQTVLWFAFGGQSYNISTADWVGGPVEARPGLCRSNIVGRRTFGERQWLVGDVFLKNVYAVFDFGEAGEGEGEGARVGFGVQRPEGEGEGEATASSSSSAAAPEKTAAVDALPGGADSTSAAKSQDQDPEGAASSSMSPANILVSILTFCCSVILVV